MTFDWKRLDYTHVYAARAERLEWIRANPSLLPALKQHYAKNPGEFINDWGVTSDPRNRGRDLPVECPFVLFHRQQEMVRFVMDRMAAREPGLVEKSRDCGASWLVASLAATLCLFSNAVVVGIGSRTENKLDRHGDPDSLFWKVKFFISHLPPEFRGTWDESKHCAHLRITVPDTGSAIVGEAGDGIGRGGRSTVYFIDEAAFIERPQLIEQSLASNTECRIDVSTPNGRANAFAIKRHSGRVKVFTFAWRDDPRKDSRWYQRQCELLDPVTRAQEIDLSYDASVEGVLIPAEWAQAAIGAHTKLGVTPTGEHRAALDVADEGKDRCAFVGRHGILLEHLVSWSGQNSDIYQTVVKTFGIADSQGYRAFDYDADGLGAGVRGDAVQINLKRREAGKHEIEAAPFRGSGAVSDPEASMVEGRFNKDYFANLKAQSWWALRLRFQATHRAVVEGIPVNPDSIISIDPQLPELNGLLAELSQPTYEINSVGKILVNKTPEGANSPNLADAAMIGFSPLRGGHYFAAPAPADIPLGGSDVYPIPKQVDYVFAVLAFVENSAGVVFCAANRPNDGSRGHGFYICDWDLKSLDAEMDAWLWGIGTRIAELDRAVGGVRRGPRGGIFIDGLDEGYANLIRQRGFPAVPIGEDLPPMAERFGQARPYINTGHVRIAQPAHDRVVTFRGTTRNFLRELSQSDVSPSNPLALAYATAVLMVYKGRPTVEAPTPLPNEGWSPHKLEKPPEPPKPVILLTPGPHVINGITVEVPRDGDKDWVWFPLERAGRHEIDGRVAIVADPRGTVRIG